MNTAVVAWLEVIELRSPRSEEALIETLLREIGTANACVDVFRCATLDGAFLVQLPHRDGPVQSRGSAEGIRIAAALRARGLVRHAVWTRDPRAAASG